MKPYRLTLDSLGISSIRILATHSNRITREKFKLLMYTDIKKLSTELFIERSSLGCEERIISYGRDWDKAIKAFNKFINEGS